jgi:hypothetical protein
LYPGFYTSLELRDEPFRSDDPPTAINDMRLLQLRFTADLSVAGRRLLPGESHAAYRTTGGIGGRVDIDHAAAGMKFDGVTLLIDGHAATVPSKDGRFYVGNLRPGIYRVRLSQESLPIEVTPGEQAYWVKVAQGAVTRVDFAATLQYGVAGRITDAAGTALADMAVQILDATGNEVARASTDAFGLYRADGLPPGSYRLEFADGDGTTSRDFEIIDGFLFAVDLQTSRTEVGEAP